MRIAFDLDDTLFHKSGRKVQGAGNFRDPIRSRPPRIVYALGLNLVVLTLRVQGPWGGEPLGLPINCRLFHKGGADHNELACEMLREVAGWFPNHRFVLCADGAFASLVADGLERTHLVSRMRRNAALYELPPPSTGRRGRPRKKGAHLASLAELARGRRRIDTLVVVGGVGTRRMTRDEAFLRDLALVAGRARRITSVCILVSRSALVSNSSIARRASASFDGRRAWTSCA